MRLKEPERITLAEGLRLLEAQVTTDEARARLRQAFVQRALRHTPAFTFPYDEAVIDWATGLVKIPKKRDRFCPTFSRSEFNAYFFHAEPVSPERPRRNPMRKETLPVLARPRAEIEQRLLERIALGRDLQKRPQNSMRDVQAYLAASGKWRDYNLELIKRYVNDPSLYAEYDTSTTGSYVEAEGLSAGHILALQLSVNQQITMLESIVGRLELMDEVAADRSGSSLSLDRSKIFVVHGHDEGALQATARFLKTIGLEPIVLGEQPDQGLTIIEKFEACASEVGFAVALLTPDDLGGAAADEVQKTRARQNVIFELGYFVGALGRGRACLLRRGQVEIPSDLAGVIYTDFDHPREGWKVKLARELKAAGMHFDASKVSA